VASDRLALCVYHRWISVLLLAWISCYLFALIPHSNRKLEQSDMSFWTEQ